METTPVETAPLTVAVFNHKGGVAKTTTACNLAVCLAAHGSRVLLVDLDMQGNATNSFGVSPLPATGACEVLAGTASLAEAMLPTLYPGVTVLPATISLRGAEAAFPSDAQPPRLLAERLAAGGVGRFADVVVVDCPPALGAMTTLALGSAGAVLIPVRPDPFAHEGLVNSWYEIGRIRQRLNPTLANAGILLTMSGAEPAGEDVARLIRAEFGEQVYSVEVPTDLQVAEAAQMALPVAVLDPDAPAGRAYMEATEELVRRMARHQRPGAARTLPQATTDAALNTLRDWRAHMHAALLRRPDRGREFSGDRPSPLRLPEDDDFEAVPPRPRQRLGWLIPLLLGLAAGALGEAVTGVVRRLL
ncbi:MAG: ParA family protein [Actinomycetota bacterium]